MVSFTSGSRSRPASSAFCTSSSRSMIFSTACATLAAAPVRTWRAEISMPLTRATSCASARSAATRSQPAKAVAKRRKESALVRTGQPAMRHPRRGGEPGEKQHPALGAGHLGNGEARLDAERFLHRGDAHLRLGGRLRQADDFTVHGEAIDIGEGVERRLRVIGDGDRAANGKTGEQQAAKNLH